MESAGMAIAIIFTLIVIGFLLVFGYQQISQWFIFQNQVQVMKVINDLEDTAKMTLDKSEGSTDTYTVKIPEAAGICFVDPKSPEKRIYTRDKTAQNWNPENIAHVKTLIKNHGYNIFYFTDGGSKLDGFEMSGVSPGKTGGTSDNFCVKNGMKVKFTNVGLYVEARPA